MALFRSRTVTLLALGILSLNSVAAQEKGLLSRGWASKLTAGTGNRNTPPQASENRTSGGILGRLFGGSGQPTRSGGGSSEKDDGRRVIQPAPRNEDVNWDGVPFHRAKSSNVAQTPQPLSDPEESGYRSGNAPNRPRPQNTADASPTRSEEIAVQEPKPRTFLAASNRSRIPTPPADTQAREPAESRSATRSLATKNNAVAGDRLPSTGVAARTDANAYQPPSSTDSSRRSGRKPLTPLGSGSGATGSAPSLEPARTAASGLAAPSPENTPAPQAAGSSNPDAIVGKEEMKVTRRPLPSPQPMTPPASTVPRDPSALSAPLPGAAAGSAGSSPWVAVQGPTNLTSPQQDAAVQDAQVQSTLEASSSRNAPKSFTIELPPAATASTPIPSTSAGSNSATRAPQSSASAAAAPALGQKASDSATAPGAAANTASGGLVNGALSGGSANQASEIPGIRVLTSGPTDVSVRKPFQYTLTVENRGAIDAPGAAIQVKLPPWIEIQNMTPSRGEIARQNEPSSQQLLWVVDGLPRTGQEQLNLQLVASEAREFSVDVEWAVVPQSSMVKVAVKEPKLKVVVEGPDQVVFGQSHLYRVRILNPGNGIAENVVFTLSPNSATPQSQQVGKILPGEEAKFDVELTARDLEALQIHGLATADLDLKVEEIKSIEVTAARLEATLAGPALRYQDSIANFKVGLTNSGTALCEQIDAVLELPAGVTYQGGLQGAVQEGSRIRWKIERLNVGQSLDYQLDCKMERTGLHTLSFQCQGTAAGNTTVQFQTQVDALADLVLTIDDPQAPAPTGEEVTYEIIIRNRGSKAAQDVSVLAQFGFDIEPIRVEGAEAKIEPGQVIFSTIDKIEPGQTKVLKVIAKAEKAGHHRFRSEVRCGDTLLIAEEATRYLEQVGQRVSRSIQGSESVDR